MSNKKSLGARSLQSLSEDAALREFFGVDKDEADETFADLDARTQQLLLSRFLKEKNRLKAANSRWKGYEDNCPWVDNEVYTDHTVDLSKGKYKGRPKQEADKTLPEKKEVKDSGAKEPVGKSPQAESAKAKSSRAKSPNAKSPKAKSTRRNYLLRQLEIDEKTEKEVLSYVRVTRSNTKLRIV
jgi:hypothetical protein